MSSKAGALEWVDMKVAGHPTRMIRAKPHQLQPQAGSGDQLTCSGCGDSFSVDKTGGIEDWGGGCPGVPRHYGWHHIPRHHSTRRDLYEQGLEPCNPEKPVGAVMHRRGLSFIPLYENRPLKVRRRQ